MTSSEKAISNFQEHILLERERPHEFYIANYGEDGLPVIDHKIDVDRFIEVDEFTLTALEYNLLAECNRITIVNDKHRKRSILSEEGVQIEVYQVSNLLRF